MIVGVGIDIVEIRRFIPWNKYSHKKLLRIFSKLEIEYCLLNKYKYAERFAARFAVKEAFYKALCQQTNQKKIIPFFAICKHLEVELNNCCLSIKINKQDISFFLSSMQLHVSISHTRHNAIAQVILEKIEI